MAETPAGAVQSRPFGSTESALANTAVVDDTLNTAKKLAVVVELESAPTTWWVPVVCVHCNTLVPLIVPVLVIVPVAVPLFPTPDLSLQVVRFPAENVIVESSAASNHSVQFDKSVGLKTGERDR